MWPKLLEISYLIWLFFIQLCRIYDISRFTTSISISATVFLCNWWGSVRLLSFHHHPGNISHQFSISFVQASQISMITSHYDEYFIFLFLLWWCLFELLSFLKLTWVFSIIYFHFNSQAYWAKLKEVENSHIMRAAIACSSGNLLLYSGKY